MERPQMSMPYGRRRRVSRPRLRPRNARPGTRGVRVVSAESVCAAALTLTVLGCGQISGETPIRTFGERGSGVTVRYPRTWIATARNDTPVDNPALCFAVRRTGSGRGDGVEVKLVEYQPPLLQRFEMH